MDRVGTSASALISVPARTVVSPLTLNVLPLRLRTICEAAPRPPPAAPGPPLPAATAPGPAGAPGAPGPPRPSAAAAHGPAAPHLEAPPPRPPAPPAVIPMRPKSPLQTAAFQVGSNLQALTSFAIPLSITT